MGDDNYTEEQIALRMNNAVRRALNTPPKSKKMITTENRAKKAALTPTSKKK
jgi:hypothetical protein